MSFGYGVGDTLALASLAWNVYKSCSDAPENFANISQEVLLLHAALRNVAETFDSQTLSSSTQDSLDKAAAGCKSVLEDLQALVEKYHSLGTSTKRSWDRLKWNTDKTTELRSRLVSNMTMLNIAISTSQVAVQKKLLKYAKERRDGTREGSMITVESVESLSRGEKEMWRNIRKDLEDIGISVEAFNANKGFILRWLQEALQSDVMEERSDGTQNVLENAPDSDGGSPVQPQDEGQECSSDASQCLDETGSRSTESPMRKDTEPSSPRGGTSSIATTLVTWLLRRYNQGFIAACDCSDLKSAEKLLKKGADINTQYHNQSALYRAAMRGDEGVVKWLFENKIGYKYAPEDYIYEPLVVAAKFGFTDVARIILSHVNVAEFSCRGQWHAALYEAVVCGKVETVNLLLDRGADVEAVLKAPSLSAGASLGSTPNKTLLQLAAAHGHVAVTNCLLDHGAKTHGRVADGKLAFSIAIEEGHFMVAKALLERTLDIDTKSASQNDIPEPTNNWLALRWLKDRGWIPNIGDSRILLGIIKNGDDETAYLLIEHGASIDFTDKLLSEAFEYGCHRALKLMLKKWRPDKVLSLQFLSSAGA